MHSPELPSASPTHDRFHEKLVASLIALEKFLGEIRASTGREEIMALTLSHLQALIPIQTAGFYFPRAEGFDFQLRTELPPAEAERLNRLVEQAVDSGVFGWALRHPRPAALKAADGQTTLILAALRTRQRVVGMFAAVVGPQSASGWDASTIVLATHLGCAADAILTEELTVELQEHNRKLDALVRQRTQQLLEAKEAAEMANRSKSVFLATISHELRTPLNAILGYTQILLGGDSLALDFQDELQTIHFSAEHLLALINDLLDISKAESSAIQIFEEHVSLHELIHETALLIRPRMQDKPIVFQCAISPGLPGEILTDARRLKQVLLNLLGNAIKFTERGVIDLKVDRGDQGVRFCVTDTGCGISAEDMPKLFEPFLRLGNTARFVEGTGLGLSISKKILAAMSVELRVRSELGKGTTFWFELPCPSDEVAGVETQGLTEVSSRADDEPLDRQLTPQSLKTLNQLCASGDVLALQRELERLAAAAPAANSLVARLLLHAKACRIKAIRDTLKNYE